MIDEKMDRLAASSPRGHLVDFDRVAGVGETGRTR
jgi:hypothetical protein